MSTYFRVVATDATPTFEPISQWMGVWSGVAAVEDEVEIARLKKAGKAEISAEEYDAELKKKAALRSNFPDFREVMSLASPVQLAAKSAEFAASPLAKPEVQTVQSVTQPAPVPPRRKSVAT